MFFRSAADLHEGRRKAYKILIEDSCTKKRLTRVIIVFNWRADDCNPAVFNICLRARMMIVADDCSGLSTRPGSIAIVWILSSIHNVFPILSLEDLRGPSDVAT